LYEVRDECIITCTFIITIIVIIQIANAFAYTLSTSQGNKWTQQQQSRKWKWALQNHYVSRDRRTQLWLKSTSTHRHVEKIPGCGVD
jgi:uncharacterized membrane protein YkvI